MTGLGHFYSLQSAGLLVVIILCSWRRHKRLTSLDGKTNGSFDLNAVLSLKARDKGLVCRDFDAQGSPLAALVRVA